MKLLPLLEISDDEVLFVELVPRVF